MREGKTKKGGGGGVAIRGGERERAGEPLRMRGGGTEMGEKDRNPMLPWVFFLVFIL